MDSKNIAALQSWIDTHEQPFIVIDHSFRVVAVNKAYERVYGVAPDEIVSHHCYETHHNDRPCFELGEECPYQPVFNSGERTVCVHTHFDRDGKKRRVQISGYPLLDGDGNLYLGEVQQELGVPAEFVGGRIRMVGKSAAFLRAVEQLQLAAACDSPVLLQGETGTGKDLAANFIHLHSRRRDAHFLTLDCTVLTESLFEAEVFGYERGAFTGSVGEKAGLFELADGGTLFLDEIGEIQPHLQAKLLRVLETGEYRRIGGRKTLHTNARIICATNRNLGQDIASKSFREDLYYRIACLHIQIPSLRQRISDIPLLTEILLQGVAVQTRRTHHLSDAAVHELQAYDYPGNVRELRNILSVAAAHCDSPVIEAQDIASVIRTMQSRKGGDQNTFDTLSHEDPPPGLEARQQPDDSALDSLEAEYLAAMQHRQHGTPQASATPAAKAPSARENSRPLEELESQYIAALLEQKRGNRRQAAAALGVSERTLYRKLKRYGLG
ncbi:MAG: sigma 54-interacting transcriptional regulator [Gammaproteobacteria bacterium]|jgi:PAS domain S-box-containing protein